MIMDIMTGIVVVVVVVAGVQQICTRTEWGKDKAAQIERWWNK